jgi:hypothetical protein
MDLFSSFVASFRRRYSMLHDLPLAVVATCPQKERRPATTTVTTSGGRHRQARRTGAVSSVQNGGGGGGSSKSARRRTLDEELRNSDGVTDEDLRLLDLEPPVFTSMAPTSGRGQKKGFLAHGTGARVPVFMGAADEFDDIVRYQLKVQVVERRTTTFGCHLTRGQASRGAISCEKKSRVVIKKVSKK